MKLMVLGLSVATAVGLFGAAATSSPGTGSAREMGFPRIAGAGGVVTVPNGVDPPRAEAKIVFDVSAESSPDTRNRGLETVARYVNLHAAAGHAAEGLKAVVVLHAAATKAALNDNDDDDYAEHLGGKKNPNLTLIGDLRAAGVEVVVCGQSLARNGYSPSAVAKDVGLAVSAMTVLVNRQQDGFAVITVH
jgi:intracellular sulfur oxidation DsrE/DsrF family protein